jgi:hypothetical protein
MAWAGQDLSFGDKFAKEFYMPGWSDLENNQTTTVKYMRKRQVPFVGRRAIIALRTGRTGGVQAVAPSAAYVSGTAPIQSSLGAAALPTPGYQPTDNAFVKPCIIMLAIGLPQDQIDLMSNDKGAFMNILDFEMMGAKADAANYEDKICYKGASDTGLGDIVSTADTTHFIPDNYLPFFKAQKLAFYTSAGAYRGPSVVTAVNRSTREITIAPAVAGLVDTDLVFTRGARPETGGAGADLVNFEPSGFEQIISTTNPAGKDLEGRTQYLGVDRTVTSEWQSAVVDCGGTFSYEKTQQVIDQISDESGGNANLAFTQKATRRKIALKFAFGNAAEPGAAATPSWRFENTIRTEGGLVPWKEDYHGQEASDWMRLNAEIPVVLDRYASHNFGTAKGTIFFLDTRHWYEAVVTNWKFWAPEGRIFREASAAVSGGAFGVIAHAYKFYQRVCDAPNTSGKLFNITA